MYSRKSNWQYIYKIFKRDYLIKDGYKQIAKTHILNGRFYRELLYLMGLKEEKVDKKVVRHILSEGMRIKEAGQMEYQLPESSNYMD
jgi:hypothetical protein